MDRPIDLTEARKYLIKLLPKAGEILRKYFESGSYSTKQKTGVDFTTQADTTIDEFLRKHLSQKYPGTQFLTEETTPKDYLSLKTAKNLWVIDPLDGTTNFSRKHPNFAISVGLVDEGIPKLGVAHLPMAKVIYWAQEDKNQAMMNDEPIHVSTTDNLREAVVGADWPWNLERRKTVVKWIGKLIPHVRQIKSMGCAVADLAWLARGNMDAYIFAGFKPWDVAAVSLLIQKAGGTVTAPDGGKWDVFNPDILASNTILHQKIINLL